MIKIPAPSFDVVQLLLPVLRKSGYPAHYAPQGGDVEGTNVQPTQHFIVLLSADEVLKGDENAQIPKGS